jgi:hypothetical protein
LVFAAYVFETNGKLVIIAQLETSTDLINTFFAAWHHGALYPQAPDALAPPVLRVRNFIIITCERDSFRAFPWIPDPVKDRSGMTGQYCPFNTSARIRDQYTMTNF